MPKLDQVAKDPRAQSVALATIAAALVLVIGAPDKADPQREDKLATLGEALARGSAETKPAQADKLDTAAIHAEISKLRDACPACVDLGVGIVDPDAMYTTGANVTKGVHLVPVANCAGRLELEGLVCVLDPGAWSISKVECTERESSSWCEVTARNTSDKAQRLLVLVEVAP